VQTLRKRLAGKIDQNHIYSIFPRDQRDQQISSRYDFDQLFPVGRSCGYNPFGVLNTCFGEMGYLFSWTSPVSVLPR
jgi:hypothetical protein